MRLHEDEIEEWHQIVYRQRNRYRRFIQDICTGVPSSIGMASDYKQLTLKEIKELAIKLLEAERD